MLNQYEVVYILKPDITEDVNLSLVQHYKIMAQQGGGKNIYIEHKGRRRLSYNIANYYDGIYVQMNYYGNGSLVNMLEKSMRFNENVMRYITVKKS